MNRELVLAVMRPMAKDDELEPAQAQALLDRSNCSRGRTRQWTTTTGRRLPRWADRSGERIWATSKPRASSRC
jgi:hypothetical protein